MKTLRLLKTYPLGCLVLAALACDLAVLAWQVLR